MRIRRQLRQRRMMCLLILSAWSFAMMLFLWKQIKEDDETFLQMNTNIYQLNRVFKEKPSKYLNLKLQLTLQDERKRRRSHKEDNIWSGLQSTQTSLTKRKRYTLKIQSRRTERTKINYGHDGDVEVEGVNDYIMWHENFQNKQTLPALPRQKRCTSSAQNIAFVKTHFTGSDVITNILNRYGDLNNLNIALPNDGLSTFFWPMRFQWKYIDITLLNGSLPNIVANHARYNNDVMDNILHPGSIYITLLRDPATQLETTFNNLGYGELLDIWNTTEQLETFLDNPKYYIQRVIRGKRFRDTLNLIKNGQFFDLGLPTTDYHRTNIIKQTIQELYDKFTLVLIYEHIDESLVLMKRRLCWEVDDILYLNFHHRNKNAWNKQNMSESLKEKIRHWNQADTQLYNFFNHSLWTEIEYEGEEFWKDLKEFKKLKEDTERDCLGNTPENKEQFFLNDDEVTQHSNPKPTLRNARLFLNTFRSSRLTPQHNQQQHSSGSGTDEALVKQEPHSNKNTVSLSKKQFSGGVLLTDELRDSQTELGSGNFIIDPISSTERILSEEASSWNNYFCKKLILNELEYLEYFRKKHAYAKSLTKHQI